MNFKFPTRAFINDPKERSFKTQSYQKYPWLHYEETLDEAFCHACLKVIKLRKISATKSEEAFKTGRKHYKKKSGLAKHNDSNSHKKASKDFMEASDDSKIMLVRY